MLRRRAEATEELAESHEINVTPFIDVMLVLLIIFMIVAPLATVDLDVDLPDSHAQASEQQDEPVYLTVKKDATLAVGNDRVTIAQLEAALDQATGGDQETRIYLRGDKDARYAQLMEAMDELRRIGYLKVALVGLDAQ